MATRQVDSPKLIAVVNRSRELGFLGDTETQFYRLFSWTDKLFWGTFQKCSDFIVIWDDQVHVRQLY